MAEKAGHEHSGRGGPEIVRSFDPIPLHEVMEGFGNIAVNFRDLTRNDERRLLPRTL